MQPSQSFRALACLLATLALCGCGSGGSGPADGARPDVTPPVAPAGLIVAPISIDQADLEWQPASDAGSGVAGYRVYRDGAEIATTTDTRYSASGLLPDTSYGFEVSAFDAATPPNVSPRSTATHVTQPPEYVHEMIARVIGCDRPAILEFDDDGRVLARDWVYAGGTFTALRNGPGWFSATATDINASGQVVGQAGFTAAAEGSPTEFHAFRFEDGVMTDLGAFGGVESSAVAINDAGQILVQARFERAPFGTYPRAFLRHGDAVEALGTLGGNWTDAYYLSESGQVVGKSSVDADDREFRAFMFDDGVMTGLGTVGGLNSEARFISGNDQVLGYLETPGGTFDVPFHFSGGTLTPLDSLGGNRSFAVGMNDSGTIYGEFATAGDAARHAFIYQDGIMTDLGTLGGSSSHALGMNNAGQVFGTSTLAGDAVTHGFLYDGGAMTDLGALGMGDVVPAAMNEARRVVGDALEGSARPFLYIDGRMYDLNKLIKPTDATKFGACGTYPNGDAEAINNLGQILVVSRQCPPYPPGSDYCNVYLLTPRSLVQ